jgi:hypothetical protein
MICEINTVSPEHDDTRKPTATSDLLKTATEKVQG